MRKLCVLALTNGDSGLLTAVWVFVEGIETLQFPTSSIAVIYTMEGGNSS